MYKMNKDTETTIFWDHGRHPRLRRVWESRGGGVRGGGGRGRCSRRARGTPSRVYAWKDRHMSCC